MRGENSTAGQSDKKIQLMEQKSCCNGLSPREGRPLELLEKYLLWCCPWCFLRSAVLRWLALAPELGFAVSITLHFKLVRRIRGSVEHRWCKVYSPSLREVLLPCSGGIQFCVFRERARMWYERTKKYRLIEQRPGACAVSPQKWLFLRFFVELITPCCLLPADQLPGWLSLHVQTDRSITKPIVLRLRLMFAVTGGFPWRATESEVV